MEEPPSLHSVQILNSWDPGLETLLISSAVLKSLNHVGAEPSQVTVLVTSDEEVAALNGRFRGVASTTDVLTFPDGDSCSGEIAIAGPCALIQSTLRAIPFEHELALLAIHGTLHLAGFDDENEEDRSRMIRTMYEVAERLGIPAEDDWGSLLHEQGIS